MPFIFPVGAQDTGYKIERSLRSRYSTSDGFTQTLAASGNRRKFTFSTWIKRGSLGTRTIWGARAGNSGNEFSIFTFDANNQLSISARNAAATYTCRYTTTAVFRDPTAWMHICLSIDTTVPTITLRVNGVNQAMSVTTALVQNSDFAWFNSAMTQYLFHGYLAAEANLDGYAAETHIIEGQDLHVSNFGELDPVTGAWVPKKYEGVYGSQSSYLKFTDNSAATASAIGKDYSGNGNNWTPSGVSVTAGATDDSVVDSPTNYGVDTGLGGQVRGNYCILNPLDNAVTLSGANLTINGAGSGWNGARGTQAVDAAKDTYWEVACGTAGTGHMIGISSIDEVRPTYPGISAASYGYQQSALRHNSAGSAAYGATYTSGDVIGVRLNAGTLTFYKNGVSQGAAFTGLSGWFFPQVSLYPDAQSYVNFGQRAFSYAAPSGSKCLCTQNLPDPAIKKSSSYFEIVSRTGTGVATNVTDKFSPGLLWIKNRSAAGSHHIADTIRGPNNVVFSDSSAAQDNRPSCISSFNADGYSLGTGAGGNVNATSNVYTDWLWRAGAATVTNNDGTISAQISTNPIAGISVVKWTGTSANGTIGHGLNATPKFILVKRLDAAQSWPVWHKSVADSAAARILFLNATDAWGSFADVFNSAAPNGTTFAVGTNVSTNVTGATYIAYVFAEIPGFSKISHYVGNGNAYGPFVWCGFRPRWLMIKRVDAAASWWMYDTVRDVSNPLDNALLYANLSDAEATTGTNRIDVLSNGFKLRDSGADNASGGTYIFAAFAEHPFKYARAN